MQMQEPGGIRVLSLLAGVTLALLSAACSEPPPLPPSSAQVLEALGVDATLPGNSGNPGDSLLPVQVVVDGSGSMQGFVNVEGSTYARVVLGLLEKSATARYDTTLYRFSDKIERFRGLAAREVVYPGFYTGSSTTLGRTLDRLAEGPLEEGGLPERITVMVSDFVHSSQGEDSLALPRAFRTLVEKSPAVTFLAFRSTFHGHYSPATHPRVGNSSYRLAIEETSASSGRPFYLLALAPTQEAMESFRKYVLDSLGAKELFEPDQLPIYFTDVAFAPNYERGTRWTRFSDFDLVRNGASIHRLMSFFVTRSGNGEADRHLRLRFEMARNLRLKVLEGIHVAIEKTSFSGLFYTPKERIEIKPSIELVTFRKEMEQDGEKVTVEAEGIEIGYPLPWPERMSWDAYRLRLNAGEANVLPPLWVANWTTNDDRAPINSNRTLNLELLIEAMIRATTEQVVFLEHFIVLGRGD